MQRKTKNGRNYDLEKKVGYNYGFTKKELLIHLLLGIIQLSLLGYIFYKSIIVIILMQGLLPLYLKYQETECRKKHIGILKLEFKEMLEIFQSFISTGYSVDNALIHTKEEMITMGFEQGAVVSELSFMIRQLKLNVSVSEMFMEWGRRTELKDIEDFAAIFELSGQTGGDTARIMRACSVNIGEKIEVERDIETMLTSRKYEQKIINAVPLLILLYVDLTSKGFLDVLYRGVFGRGIMSLCMLVYFISYLVSNKIMNIEV